jgi:hypothetical protein
VQCDSTSIVTEWPEHTSVSCKPFVGLITTDAPRLTKLTALRLSGWEVHQNPEFTYLKLSIASRISVIERWVDVFSCIGQQYNMTVKTLSFTVHIPRPVCTYHTSTTIYLHHLNCIPCLNHSP